MLIRVIGLLLIIHQNFIGIEGHSLPCYNAGGRRFGNMDAMASAVANSMSGGMMPGWSGSMAQASANGMVAGMSTVPGMIDPSVNYMPSGMMTGMSTVPMGMVNQPGNYMPNGMMTGMSTVPMGMVNQPVNSMPNGMMTSMPGSPVVEPPVNNNGGFGLTESGNLGIGIPGLSANVAAAKTIGIGGSGPGGLFNIGKSVSAGLNVGGLLNVSAGGSVGLGLGRRSNKNGSHDLSRICSSAYANPYWDPKIIEYCNILQYPGYKQYYRYK